MSSCAPGATLSGYVDPNLDGPYYIGGLAANNHDAALDIDYAGWRTRRDTRPFGQHARDPGGAFEPFSSVALVALPQQRFSIWAIGGRCLFGGPVQLTLASTSIGALVQTARAERITTVRLQ